MPNYIIVAKDVEDIQNPDDNNAITVGKLLVNWSELKGNDRKDGDADRGQEIKKCLQIIELTAPGAGTANLDPAVEADIQNGLNVNVVFDKRNGNQNTRTITVPADGTLQAKVDLINGLQGNARPPLPPRMYEIDKDIFRPYIIAELKEEIEAIIDKHQGDPDAQADYQAALTIIDKLRPEPNANDGLSLLDQFYRGVGIYATDVCR